MSDIRPYLRKCAIRRLPMASSVDQRSRFAASCAAVVDAGATALVIDPSASLGSSRQAAPQIRDIFDLCHSRGVLAMVIDDVLLLMQTGAHAICFTRCPPSYPRVREVVGPQVFIGRSFAERGELEQTKATGGFTHLDFCAAGRWRTPADRALSDGEPCLESLHRMFDGRPSLLLEPREHRHAQNEGAARWDGYLFDDERPQALGETVLMPAKACMGQTHSAQEDPAQTALRNHG
jgi:hypothetical protein